MEPHTTTDTQGRGMATWIPVTFFVCAGLNLLQAKWVAAAFFLAAALIFLKQAWIERRPRWVRYSAVATLAVLGVAMFVKLILDFKARG